LALRNDRIGAFCLLLLSPVFSREGRAVVSGLRLHSRSPRTGEPGTYTLRRNVHRLEKGLLMRPRREVFARAYIRETVECYKEALQDAQMGDSLPTHLRWARDVLRCYFAAVAAEDPPIRDAKRAFEAMDDPPDDSREDQTPHARQRPEKPVVEYEDLLELASGRKSVRWYLPKPVPRELIDKAITLAKYAPSACNRQPFEFLVFDSPESVAKVATLPAGTAGYSENIPAMIVVVGDLGAFISARDRHLIYIDSSLAAMSLVLALESLGLSSCCINWPDIEENEAQIAELLGLQPHQRVVMCIAAGYADPDGLVAYSARKSLGELRRFPDV